MSQATQQIFKRIILRNKILSASQLDTLLEEYPDPEQAIKRMVRMETLSSRKAKQLLALFHAKVDEGQIEKILLGRPLPIRKT